jgi:parallel beta-helix repeat protein
MKRLLFVCLILLCLISTAHAREYVVDPAGKGDFSSITDALRTVTDGDTLFLAGGTYDESQEVFPILVEKTVTILSMQGEQPVIVSPRLVPALELNADGIHVSGLEINFLRSGMWIQGNDVIVENCTMSLASEEWRTSSCGMWVAGAKRLTLKNCSFFGCGVAMAGPPVSDSSKGLPVLTGMFEVGEDIEFFTGHNITDCTVNSKPLAYIVNMDDAVYTEPCGQLIAVGCDGTTFTGLDCSKTSMGITSVYCINTIIENCIADDAGIFGIYVAKAKDCILRNCRADRGAHGIDLRAIHRCIVTDCSSNGSGQGMFFSMAYDSLLTGCNIIENGTGFFAASGNRNHMAHCLLEGNQLGIYIQKEPNFTVTDCTFRANWNTGARSSLAPGYALINCSFKDNWVAAMSNYSDGVFYYNNTFTDSQSCSMYMKGNTQVRLLENQFSPEDAALIDMIECTDVLNWPQH